MHNPESAHRCLLAALAGAVLAVLVMPASGALAETYGELRHYGSAGVGHGQFKLTSGTHAFGVDTTDNSVYVGDEPKKGEYRIQKLTAAGAFVAATAPFKPANHAGLEGIAVDPAEHRIYVLALEKREATLTNDPSVGAAGTVYAFSTQPTGEELTPAGGTVEGVLTSAEAFAAQSDALEAALLNPRGIAVDPTTHDVVVLGEIDEGAPKAGAEPVLRTALQRVHANGTLGDRYVDGTDFFGEATPNSPVVTPHGAVYVALPQAQADVLSEASVDELAQIPSNFASTAPPTPHVQLALRGSLPSEENNVVEFNGNEPAKAGGGMSLAPDGSAEGTIYAKAHAFNAKAFYPAVLAFNGLDGTEIGWTGGQTRQFGGEACTIGFIGPTYASVAAGKDRIMFVLDPQFAHVIEFGPEGTGCPTADASDPVATVNGQPLPPAEAVPTGTSVAFGSKMTQANALSVEWSFGDGQTATVNTDEYQHTEVTHKFTQGGELTVTETIHTDNLATPTIVKQAKIAVSATAPPPTAVLEGPTEVTLGGSTISRLEYLEGGGLGVIEAPASEATFDASASFASTAQGPNQIATYKWSYGDGHTDTTTTPIARHLYESVGVYKVELTVTDALGLTSEPATIVVKVKNAPPSPTGKAGSGAPPEAIVPTVAPSAEQGAPAAGNHTQATPQGHGTPVPDVVVHGATLTASRTGVVTLALACPTGKSGCAGTVTLRTLEAIGARATGSPRTRKRKAAILTLASGTFTVAGGRTKTVALRLTSAARMLLTRTRRLRAQATFAARDPAGETHITRVIVTLRAPKIVRRRGH
jgi:PKD repeat protein